jgi:trehalose 6-phosphate synthase/phosphatase
MSRRLIIVSNRLPVVVEREGEEWKLKPGSGGLVTALGPVLKEQGGLWIGWPGSDEDAPYGEIFRSAREELGYEIEPVSLSPGEVDGFYYGCSNETFWPLFHGLLGRTIFDRENYEIYRSVNRKFAGKILETTGKDDFVWVQDYQLLLAGMTVRERRPGARLGFFLHIPFPSPDIFTRLPWREEILQGLLAYDLIGFQTRKDLRNFIQCVRALLPEATVGYRTPNSLVTFRDRTSIGGAFPIGIDFDRYRDLARSRQAAEGAWFLHEKFPKHKLVLGIDRLDYTKGIPQRLEAFEVLLEKHPELHTRISLIQVVVPSRMGVPEYQEMKRELDELVGRINGDFTVLGWVPIHYIFGTLTPVELVAHYRSCEIALITPLNDGMNLVAKEYCASCIDNRGVLVLSEFAGAARQLKKGAILANPYDTEGTAEAIYRAFTMSDEEKERRMRYLRGQVRRHDVFRWVSSFLQAAEEIGKRV